MHTQPIFLFYNKKTGVGLTTDLSDIKQTYSDFAHGEQEDQGWTHASLMPARLQPVPILFYNMRSGAAATGWINVSGVLKTTRVYKPRDFASGWSHVVATSQGLWLFYNATSGESATGTILDIASGAFSTLGNRPDFALGWTHLVCCRDRILFYNKKSGTGATGELDTNGNFKTLQSFRNFAGGEREEQGWTHVTGGQSHVLFYNAATGAAATGSISDAGVFTTQQTYDDLARNWTHIASAGDYFHFYDAKSSARAVARIENNGRLITSHSHDTSTFGAGHTQVVGSMIEHI